MTTRTSTFAERRAAEEQHRAVPAHRRGRDWHGAVEVMTANPRRTRGLRAGGAGGAVDAVKAVDARLERTAG